jgi:methylenetetrahydrofolate dehydrogenase (NADP+)/methenyltetrahydrofolate cyclohydrolase/formyltetrahydrofolate synthetase/formate--tetrahydrofolate ligase
VIKDAAMRAGAVDAVVCKHWELGGEGAMDLARAVEKACETSASFKFLYPLDLPLKEKIETLAREVYGAESVEYSPDAAADLDRLEENGYGKLPICTAKTQYSLSHDSALKGAPRGYVFPIREVRLSAGAGFVYPLCGDMTTMPGLPSKPAFMGIDVDADGRISGLS